MYKIAIDGPGGAGKSTVAKAVAKKLGITYVDTGALYRTVGLYVRAKNVDPKNEAAVAALLPEIQIEMAYENGTQVIYLNGENVGDRIRTQEMSMYASAVSAHPAVRDFLLATQRNIAKTQSIVMDGRDIGTVIFPDAEVKIFLTATPEDRARRRYEEQLSRGIAVEYEQVLAEIIERDHNDSTRAVAPLKPAEDAVILDNTGFSVEMSAAAVADIICRKLGVSL